MRATVEEQFQCPYCADGSHALHAPLASKFAPHKGLCSLLSGQRQGDQPRCEECAAGQDPHPATVHCTDCKANLCNGCDGLLHHTRVLRKHARIPVDKSVPLTMCRDHADQPVSNVCEECDGALLCASCQNQPGAPHKGHRATAVEHSATLLGQQLGTLLEGLLARCRAMATATVEWKGQ
eukprot:gene12979-biopygen7089